MLFITTRDCKRKIPVGEVANNDEKVDVDSTSAQQPFYCSLCL